MKAPLAAIAALCAIGIGAEAVQRGPVRPSPLRGDRECSIAATGVDFGLYDTVNVTPADSTGTISYGCSQGGGALNVVITIDRGFAGSFNRTMTNGTDRLKYNLYLDVGHTIIWGDGSAGTQPLNDKVPGNSSLITATVYGRVFPRQNVGSGVYADGLTVTMLF